MSQPAPVTRENGTVDAAKRRRAQVLRRRIVALASLAVVVAAAVVIPLVLRSGVIDEAAGAQTGSGGVQTAASKDPASAPMSLAASAASTEEPAGGSLAPTTGADGVSRAYAREIGANELGLVPILMYHKIGADIVPPARLREDINLLKQAGFYPTTVREMVQGTMDIPAGKSPVILTFDDSSPTHYRILEDGTLDPDCAVAILLAAVDAGDWAPKACFFPLLYVDSAANILFGQPEHAELKLQNLVEWGFEVGSHTMTHRDLSEATPEQIHKELAQSQTRLEEMIGGGYELFTLNPPFGEYPDDVSLLVGGEYDGASYDFSAVLMAAGGRSFSPFSTEFDPLRIRRITAYPPETVGNLVSYFQEHPEMRFVSDGDPKVVSAPLEVPVELGTLARVVPKRVVRY